MTHSEFKEFVEGFLKELGDTLPTANHEYANGGDRQFADSAFSNFETSAAETGVTREVVNRIFRGKHAQAIQGWINGIEQKREGIRGRMIDMIAYDIIWCAMLFDKEEKDKPFNAGEWLMKVTGKPEITNER